jgi:hypothetical protein
MGEQPFQAFAEFVFNGDENDPLAKMTAERDYALHSLDRELALNAEARAHREALVKALEELTAACESDFMSPSTEAGVQPCADDEPVAYPEPDCALTFGHIRRAHAALAAVRESEK